LLIKKYYYFYFNHNSSIKIYFIDYEFKEKSITQNFFIIKF